MTRESSSDCEKRSHPSSTLFPYTTLFRSQNARVGDQTDTGPSGAVDDVAMLPHAPADLARRDQQEALDALERRVQTRRIGVVGDRKSTRLNSSHVKISYAVFCLKKKNNLA